MTPCAPSAPIRIKKLVTPRVISTVFMLFFLTIISDLVGLVGGWIISFSMLGLEHSNTGTALIRC